MKPAFLITIDTEPDNQWIPGKQVSLENLSYIPRFQDVCESFNFKPVWLTEYNVALDPWYISYMNDKKNKKLCEVGIHPHAWTTPPYSMVTEDDFIHKPYMTDYSFEVMKIKFENHLSIMKQKFGEIETHRSGRWAMNYEYVKILSENGIKYDCTMNPGTKIPPSSHLFPKGSCDYSNVKNEVFNLSSYYNSSDVNLNTVYEVPFTILTPKQIWRNILPYQVRRKIFPTISLRPNGTNIQSLLKILTIAERKKMPFVEFMLHSSELMPACSPVFPDKNSIEKLYKDLDVLFTEASKYFTGYTIKEYMSEVLKSV